MRLAIEALVGLGEGDFVIIDGARIPTRWGRPLSRSLGE